MSELTPQEKSPLAEASATSLEDLFNKDPLKLTEQDLKDTVNYLRRARETFLRDEKAKPKKIAGVKAEPKKALDDKLTIGDLEL